MTDSLAPGQAANGQHLPSPQPISSPSPAHPFRPAPARAATLGGPAPTYGYKSRAASQPAGERLPAPTSLGGSQPDSGRGSPAGMFGVIGGSRTPGRFGSGFVGGTATRASSFSAGEMREPRNTSLTRTLSSHMEEHPSRSQSTSPFPTFSPSSTPSTSPNSHLPIPLHNSPPKAGANVSRSRSQSLAVGVRPIPERGFPMPMSSLENTGAFPRSFDPGWVDPVEGSNMSPFTRNMASLGVAPQTNGGRFKSPVEGIFPNRGFSTGGGWGSSAPEPPTSALSSSVAKAFGGFGHGQPPFSTLVGGFGESNANGGRSGTSSRRHSVSVVGGPGGRRDVFAEGMGMGMTSPPGRGLGPLGFTDAELLPEKLGNALNLEIDESRRRGVEIEVGKARQIPQSQSSTFPKFEPLQDAQLRTSPYTSGVSFGTSPAGGRGAIDRDSSNESRSTASRSRFNFEGGAGVGANGPIGGPSPDRGRVAGAVGSGPRGLGAIGAPPNFDPRMGYQPQMYGGRPPFQGPGGMGPPSPIMSTNQPNYGRPPVNIGGGGGGGGGFYGGPGRPPTFSPGNYAPPGGPGGNNNFAPPPQNQPPGYNYYPSGSPPQPTSPSFSTLSLSDLGRGVPLSTLNPTSPLYIVTFKAGRRDVYYCPDPTLLISNGDRVIVEADRGSDLGTVVYDQLTPIDVREWQEKQATAALLSGAREHQPPGMAVAGAGLGNKVSTARVVGGELAGADLHTLLAGVGGGQMDSPMGSTSQGRGPLAKEIMPKRIFAKSSQGPEEQARMLEKMRDEHEAMLICREKAAQRGLPMQIVDAEYQWDRRKLTFYFKADKRIDFRDLTKENFRVFKSRIWMAMVPKDDPRTG